MIVRELIEALQGINMPNAEISYEMGNGHIELLIGEDEDTGESIYIEKPNWP